jgi:hypothetical protein
MWDAWQALAKAPIWVVGVKEVANRGWLVPISPAFQEDSVVGRRVPWRQDGVDSGDPRVPRFMYLFWERSQL